MAWLFLASSLLARDLSGAPQIAKLPDHKANACTNQNDHFNNF
jgi:hypothetical protein